MATFQIPQFIDEQPKVVGFLTLPQFLYLAAAVGISFASFYVFTFFLWLLITLLVAAIAIGLAFIKINAQPLPAVLRSALAYYWKPRVYTWSRMLPETTLPGVAELQKIEALRRKMGIEETLRSLALQITTGKIFSRLPEMKKQEKQYEVVTYLTGEKKVAKRVDYKT
ncbi:MAG: PrgI family protein [Candidatus Brennerbacteria bacterium]